MKQFRNGYICERELTAAELAQMEATYRRARLEEASRPLRSE